MQNITSCINTLVCFIEKMLNSLVWGLLQQVLQFESIGSINTLAIYCEENKFANSSLLWFAWIERKSKGELDENQPNFWLANSTPLPLAPHLPPPSIQTGHQIHPFVSCVYLMGGKVYLRVDLLVIMIEFWPLALVPILSCIQASILERMTRFYTFMQLLQLLSYVARK